MPWLEENCETCGGAGELLPGGTPLDTFYRGPMVECQDCGGTGKTEPLSECCGEPITEDGFCVRCKEHA